MSFSLGIIGLPNVGKSTLFNALSKAGAEVSNYPFCTKSKNVGVVAVPDERLEKVRAFMKSPKSIPTIIEFVDIAGLVKNAHKGEGLGNQFLSYVREVAAIVHVVRCFSDPNIAHVEGSVDPKRDIEIVNTELVLADLATAEKRLTALRSAAKSKKKEALKELEIMEKVKGHLNEGKSLRLLPLAEDEQEAISDLHLLTGKPILYMANIGENDPQSAAYIAEMEKIAQGEKAKVINFSSRLEVDLAELSVEEAREYLKEAGIKEAGLDKLVKASYELLDLITFFTANEKEARAWTIRRGTKAPRAAGKVHSDMEKGFISAEVVAYPELKTADSLAKVRETGHLQKHGKDYVVSDGDLIYFRFNV